MIKYNAGFTQDRQYKSKYTNCAVVFTAGYFESLNWYYSKR